MKLKNIFKKKQSKGLKVLVLFLELFAVALVLYLIALPFYPGVKYRSTIEEYNALPEAEERVIIEEQVAEFRGGLPENKFDVSPNRVIIPKIGVNAPIVVTDNADYGLSQGAWLVPNTSSPDKGGNTVITGHRFKYLPPHNLTFYLFDKLETGDLVSIIWQEKDYLYRIKEVKIVDDTEVSILNATDEPILTMFTCHPIYSTEQRLVVISELVEE
ncbi:sortase [Candidatus Parcubacteria bacterium]|nr:sortase [Candidatus Parcubacteria bacterium]